MNQRTESASHHGHGKSPISYGVAVVACLTIATDYIQTFGIVPILPLYFQEIDLFDAQLPIFQSGSNVLSQNFSSFQTSPTDEYLIIENVSYSRIEVSFHKTLETPIIQDGSTQQTHMSAIGYVVLIKWAAQIMICPLVGRMIDQYGVRWPAVFGFIIEIVFCAVFVLADSVLMFILARAIQGMASAFVVTSMLSWLTFSYSGETRKTITGYAFVTIDMGVSFGPPLIGTLYGLCDIVWTMVVQSMLFATLFVAFMLLCKPQSQLSTASTSDYHPLALEEDPEPPDEDPEPPTEDPEPPTEDPEPPTEDPEPPATRQGIVSLLKDRRMICIAVQLVILDWAVIAWAPILPVFMDDQLGEAHAITSVFCPRNRTDQLLIGSVKSNMGHPEPAAGLCQIVKVLLAIQHGKIPPNLHYEEPNAYIPSLSDSRLKVVTEVTPCEFGYVAVNSFGFGGSNTHVILKAYANRGSADSHDPVEHSVPRLVLAAGRTSEGVKQLLTTAVHNGRSYQALLAQICNMKSSQNPYRGFTIAHPFSPIEINEESSESNQVKCQVAKVAKWPSNMTERPIWFVYCGMGAQWAGMARELQKIDVFRMCLLRCAEATRRYGIDCYDLIMKGTDEEFENVILCMVTVTAIQIALTDLLGVVGLKPSGFLGHSTGEIVCGYMDGLLTRSQTILCAYMRAHLIVKHKLNENGAMAAIGLGHEEMVEKLQDEPSVVVACHNARDSVTISGPKDKVTEIVDHLSANGIFAKMVNSANVAFHSPSLKTVVPELSAELNEILYNTKMRSDQWISSCVSDKDEENTFLKLCSSQYQIQNLVEPVLFHEAVQKIPEHAIVIEVGPHALLRALIKRTVPTSCTIIGLMQKGQQKEISHLFSALGTIHQCGITLHPEALFPQTQLPVAVNTGSIAPQIDWDHDQSWLVVSMDQRHLINSSSTSFNLEPYNSESPEHYLLDHVIDGRLLFPFAGYIWLAWSALGRSIGIPIEDIPIVLTDFTVHRPVVLEKQMLFEVYTSPVTGMFNISQGETLLADGKITRINTSDEDIFIPELPFGTPHAVLEQRNSIVKDSVSLNSQDIYKELMVRGYDYKKAFRTLHSINTSCRNGQIQWTGNWVTFIDACVQSWLIADSQSVLRLPSALRYLRIEPKRHLQSIKTLDSGESVIALETYTEVGGCVAGGVQLRDLTAGSVKRRHENSNGGKLYLDRSVFTPYHDTQCTKGMPIPDFQAYQEYKYELDIAMCHLSKKLIKSSITIPELLKSAIGKYAKRSCSKLTNTVDTKDNALLQMYSELEQVNCDQPIDIYNQIAQKFKQTIRADRFYNIMFHPWLFEPFLHVFLRNNASNNVYLANISSSPDLHGIKQSQKLINRQPMIQSRWTVIGPHATDPVDQEYILKNNIQELLVDENWKFKQQPEELVKFNGILWSERGRSSLGTVDKILDLAVQALAEGGFIMLLLHTDDELTAVADWLLVEHSSDTNDIPLPKKHMDTEYKGLFAKHGLNIVGEKAHGGVLPGINYLLRKTNDSVKSIVTVDCDNELEDLTWLQKCQDFMTDQEQQQIWMVNRKASGHSGLPGLVMCMRDEDHTNLRVRYVVNLSDTGKPHFELDLNNEERRRLHEHNLLDNCYKNGQWGHLVSMAQYDESHISMKKTAYAFVNTVTRGDLNSLKWIESELSLQPNRRSTAPDVSPRKQLIHVYYSGLIFRDVMLATGALTPDAIGDDWRDREQLLGCEVAGRLEDGTRVVAFAKARCIATTLMVDSRHIWPIPDTWSMAEAVAIPIGWLTAFLAFNVQAQIKDGESVLIHSGAGCVGMCSIELCLARNCKLFITVGTKEKKEFLMKRYPQLEDWQFGNSRSTEFEKLVMDRTRGRGVDVVLNSLARNKLMASVRCLARYGRFIEIGKYDLWNNSPIGLRAFMKNISFHSVLLDCITSHGNPYADQIMPMMTEALKTGLIKKIPLKIFDEAEIELAFRHMLTGDHIGKVVLRIREEQSPPTKVVMVPAMARIYFRADEWILITGGLGGFGIELANWMVERGARKLVLTSRSGVRTGYQKRWIEKWRLEHKCEIETSTLDVCDSDQCEHLLKKYKPGGIFHLAMVLKDALFENQTAENFQETARSKYLMLYNLDLQSRKYCSKENLKWFCAFSSITAARGNVGQTAYAWANSAMERLIEKRRHEGLVGCAIQWGPIGDVGVIIDKQGTNSTVINGTLPQRIGSCLRTMDVLLHWDQPVMSSYVRAAFNSNQLSDRQGGVIEALAAIMGVQDHTTMDLELNLSEFGIDSLMGVEIRQVLERQFNIVLTMNDIRTLTLADLKKMAESGGGSVRRNRANESLSAEERLKLASSVFNLRLSATDFTDQMYRDIVPLNNLGNEIDSERKLFFVHPIEGFAVPLKKLSEKVLAPAYCLQWTPNTPCQSLHTVAEHYVKVLRSAHPQCDNTETGYRLIGYSYGASIALEMALIIRQQGKPVQLALIDGSHVSFQIYRKAYREAFGHKLTDIRNNAKFEIDLLTQIADRFQLANQQLISDMTKEKCWEERVGVLLKALSAVGLAGSTENQERARFFVNATRDRFLGANDYEPCGVLDCDVLLIRAANASFDFDFGLHKMTTGRVHEKLVQADHDSIVREHAHETANQINEYFKLKLINM